MTLRFSADPSEFPGRQIDSLLAGEAVFLCGTGVSAPQMPRFGSLVDSAHESLVVPKTDSEGRALANYRYEEILG